ncbi:MAG TPA: hypothetical protein VFE95_05810 [Pseudomonas sp.]|nr:hypothetical protein [Pseudomonas sp.]
MARARNIKPAFFKNYELADAGPIAQILFAGLWCLADREGRLEDKPRLIKAELFPYYDCDVNGELTVLQRLGFVRRYVTAGVSVVEVLNFKKHQAPHNTEKASTLPAFVEGSETPAPSQAPETVVNGGLTVVSPSINDGKTPDSLIPDSLSSDSLIPDSPIPEEKPLQLAAAPAPQSNVKTLEPKQRPPKAKTEQQQANAATWQAYAAAYFDRYSVEPVRNAKVNAQIGQLVSRLGAEEAPHVAAYFVSINDQFYLRSLHDFGLLVSKAEAIRTQWATGRQMNGRTARQLEDTQANVNAAQEAARLIRERAEGSKRNVFL